MTRPSTPPSNADVIAATERRLRGQARVRAMVLLIIGAVVFGLDQLSKVIVRASIERGEEIGLFPGFQLSHIQNDGIAFGLFPGRPGLIAALTVIALVGIGFAVLRAARHSLAVTVGGGMLIGGSVGNLIDRIYREGVTDFLDPVAWPAFNLADIGIVCGACLVVVGLALYDNSE